MLRDLRFSLRTFSRRPGFASIILITLALGIGGSTAVFSVVNAVLLLDLPYQDADQLYVMRAVSPDGSLGNVSWREFEPIHENENHPTVEKASIVWSQEVQIVGSDGTPYLTRRYGVTYEFFEVFGARMELGPGLDDQSFGIVLAYSTWRDLFGSDPDIVGKAVMAEGRGMPVAGVVGAEFDFPEDPGYWFLMRLGPGFNNIRAYRGFVRLRPGRSHDQIQSDFTRLAGELGADPITGQTPVLIAQPFLEHVVGDLKSTVLMLFGATAILLLIASINVTNLLLSWATVRTREMALREAVGAGRWRVIRQFLTESLLLTAIGGVLGLAIAAAGIRLFLSIAPTGLPRLETVPIDTNVLGFAVGVTLLTGVLVGLAPAFRLAWNPLRTLINEGGRGTPGGGERNRLFSVLVVTEISLAVLLVIGAGLLVRSYTNLMGTDPGFNPDRILTMNMNVPGRVEGSVVVNEQGENEFRGSYLPMANFFRELEERLQGLAGVEAVASTRNAPLGNQQVSGETTFELPGQPSSGVDAATSVATQRAVSPGFFRLMDIRLLAGRAFLPTDRRDTAGAAVVNETFARRFLPGQDPLGQRIHFPENRWTPSGVGFQFSQRFIDDFEIVGVVEDVKYAGLTLPAEPSIYLSSEQWVNRRRAVVVRTSVDNPSSLVPAIERELEEMDPLLSAQFATYDSILRTATARERLGMTLLVTFGLVALVLAAGGIYGLMSHSVSQRTGEIAVRSAMGASASQIMRSFMRRGVLLATGGIVLGMIGAIALRQVVASELVGVSALDLRVFVLVPLVLFAVAALACFVPAKRATRIDPADLLRIE